MKKFRFILVSKEYWEFEVEAETEVLARIEAVQRKDNGHWGKNIEYPTVEIYDVEEIKHEGSK